MSKVLCLVYSGQECIYPGKGWRQWFSNFRGCEDHLEDLLKYRSLGATPRVSDSGGLSSDLRIYFFNKFSGDADLAGLDPHLHPQFKRQVGLDVWWAQTVILRVVVGPWVLAWACENNTEIAYPDSSPWEFWAGVRRRGFHRDRKNRTQQTSLTPLAVQRLTMR